MIIGFFSAIGRPYILGTVTLPRFDVSTDVYFLLDTGADSSCLHLEDTRNLSVPESSLSNGESCISAAIALVRAFSPPS